MRTLKLLSLFILCISISSCSDDDNDPQLQEVESRTVENLFAPQEGGQGQPVTGEFVKFDFEAGVTTTSETEWDIAFRGTTILVNGGSESGIADEPARNGNAAAYIENGTFAEVDVVDASKLVQDTNNGLAIPTGSGNGWYTYNPMNNTINPIAGKVLVFRTRDGKFAKVEILSYYRNSPEEITPEIAANDLRYYTFNYVYQPNENVLVFNQ